MLSECAERMTDENEAPNMRAEWSSKILRVEWLGQTAASLCWIASVLAYGVSSLGDWLQLFAASAWLIANFASVANTKN